MVTAKIVIETVAFHEMGHALVAMALPGTDPVHKISIIVARRPGRGNARVRQAVYRRGRNAMVHLPGPMAVVP